MKKVLLFILMIFPITILTSCSTEKESTKKKADSISVEVKDLTAPTISLKKENIDLYIGDSFTAEDYVSSCFDNLDGKIKCTITGKVNTSKSDTYRVKFSAKDKAGNVSSKILQVTVKEKEKVPDVKAPRQSDPSDTESDVPNIQQPLTISPPSSSLPPQQFLFSTGYTMPGGDNPADVACLLYKGTHNGTCSPLKDESGTTFIGMQYSP